MKDRITFTLYGSHPLLLLVRDYFILRGFQLQIDESCEVDFVLVGGHVTAIPSAVLQRPILLLSSDGMYSDKDIYGYTRETVPMSEDSASLFCLPHDIKNLVALQSLCSENVCINRTQPTVTVRPFNVYGPHITSGVINTFLAHAKAQTPMVLQGNSYQTRTFLHETDFLTAMEALAKLLVSGRFGIYNVGSNEVVSIKRLADSVWQLTNPNTPPLTTTEPADRLKRQWKCPDLQRILAATAWKPTISLRRGIWTLLHEEKEALL